MQNVAYFCYTKSNILYSFVLWFFHLAIYSRNYSISVHRDLPFYFWHSCIVLCFVDVSSLFNYSPMYEHFGCFKYFPIRNNVAVYFLYCRRYVLGVNSWKWDCWVKRRIYVLFCYFHISFFSGPVCPAEVRQLLLLVQSVPATEFP